METQKKKTEQIKQGGEVGAHYQYTSLRLLPMVQHKRINGQKKEKKKQKKGTGTLYTKKKRAENPKANDGGGMGRRKNTSGRLTRTEGN